MTASGWDGSERLSGAPAYFTAPNRLSNEFDCTTGAAPMIWVASPAPSDTDGFSVGRVAARRVSGFTGSAGFGAGKTRLRAALAAFLGVLRPRPEPGPPALRPGAAGRGGAGGAGRGAGGPGRGGGGGVV